MGKLCRGILVVGLLALFFVVVSVPSNSGAQATRNSIVIVPGILGSWNWDIMLNKGSEGKWDFFSLDHTFDNLIQAFEDEGLVRDEDYFIAFYDWRKSNVASAENYLKPAIDKAKATSESGKVDIVAYSMGGLVARSYIQGDGYRYDVDRLILLGTPNAGSGDVYALWEGGVIPKNWDKIQKALLDSYIWYMTTVTKDTDDAYDAIHEHVPSIREMLPTYDYLEDTENSNELKYVGYLHEQNPLLGTLNHEFEIFALLADRVQWHTKVIAGEGEGTVGTIPVKTFTPADEEEQKLWKDGIPEPMPPARNDTDGDNRVLLSSAFFETPDPGPLPVQEDSLVHTIVRILVPPARAGFFDPFLEQVTVDAKHGELPTKALPEIFDELELSDPDTYAVTAEPDALLSFWIASPVSVVVTDPNGNHISVNENTIPGAIYTGEDDPLGVKMVIIPNPENGPYILDVTGLGEGEYHVGVSHIATENDIVETIVGIVEEGDRVGYTVNYNESLADDPLDISAPYTPAEPTIADELGVLITSINNYRLFGDITRDPVARMLRSSIERAQASYSQILAIHTATPPLRFADLKIKFHKTILISHLDTFIAKAQAFKRASVVSNTAADDLVLQAQQIKNRVEEEIAP